MSSSDQSTENTPPAEASLELSQAVVIEVIKTIIDPELFLDIWTLGLIYEVNIDEDLGKIGILMTFTSPACPAGPELVEEVRSKLVVLPSVKEVSVDVTLTPPWQPSEELRALLGI
jgi:metal-sulfur cluster biosynthetic enzyme